MQFYGLKTVCISRILMFLAIDGTRRFRFSAPMSYPFKSASEDYISRTDLTRPSPRGHEGRVTMFESCEPGETRLKKVEAGANRVCRFIPSHNVVYEFLFRSFRFFHIRDVEITYRRFYHETLPKS